MDWKALISTVAPWIGTALGGPLGGAAVTAVADALGLSEKTEESIKSALSGVTPEQMLAVKNADQAFQVKMQELGYANTQALAALAVENTKDARLMQMTTKSVLPALLAVLITIGFFGILVGMLLGDLKASENQALLLLLGSLGAAWGSIVNFYFGSSAGSQNKDEVIARSSNSQ